MNPDETEDGGFTVRDRRRFSTDEETAAVAPPAPPRPEPVTTATAPYASDLADQADFLNNDEQLNEQMETQELPDIYSVLALFLGELRNLAWLRMGLVANPGTGQIERDLAQAKIAIDTVGFLAGQLEGVVPPEEKLPLRALVSDLQMNFVEQSKKS